MFFQKVLILYRTRFLSIILNQVISNINKIVIQRSTKIIWKFVFHQNQLWWLQYRLWWFLSIKFISVFWTTKDQVFCICFRDSSLPTPDVKQNILILPYVYLERKSWPMLLPYSSLERFHWRLQKYTDVSITTA